MSKARPSAHIYEKWTRGIENSVPNKEERCSIYEYIFAYQYAKIYETEEIPNKPDGLSETAAAALNMLEGDIDELCEARIAAIDARLKRERKDLKGPLDTLKDLKGPFNTKQNQKQNQNQKQSNGNNSAATRLLEDNSNNMPPIVEFLDWWNLYGYNVEGQKGECAGRWSTLTAGERERVMAHTRQYKDTPNKLQPYFYLVKYEKWRNEIPAKPKEITFFDGSPEECQKYDLVQVKYNGRFLITTREEATANKLTITKDWK